MKKDRRTKAELIEDIAKLQNRLMEAQCELEDIKHERWALEQANWKLRTELEQISLIEKFKHDRVGFQSEDESARSCNCCRHCTVKSDEITKGSGRLYPFCTWYGIKDCHLVNSDCDCGSFEEKGK